MAFEKPAVGRSTACLLSKLVCNCAVDVSMAAGAPVTSIDVVVELTAIVMFTVVVRLSCRSAPVTVALANPAAAAETSYRPIGTLLMRYSPEVPVTVGYFTPVSLFKAMMLALGMPAPVASVTTPTIILSEACPKLEMGKRSTAAHNAAAQEYCLRSVITGFMCPLSTTQSVSSIIEAHWYNWKDHIAQVPWTIWRDSKTRCIPDSLPVDGCQHFVPGENMDVEAVRLGALGMPSA